MDLPLKQLSNAGRRKLPVLTEALRLRHIRRRAFMSELIAELGVTSQVRVGVGSQAPVGVKRSLR